MILENPALTLSIKTKDVTEVLEGVLKERNWKHFELANLKLVYVPFYIFNYDTLVEQEVQGQTYSQGFSGLMAMNAITGKLEPLLTQVMEQQPVDYEREISHDLKYEMQNPAISMKEVKETANIKLAGQFNVGKDSMAVAGFRLVYWPIWRIFVTLPSKAIQKIEIEGVSGYPMNIEEVPEREKTWIEVTEETLDSLKTAKGWADLTKKAVQVTATGLKGKKEGSGSKASSLITWLFKTKTGLYSLVAIAVLIAIILLL